MRKSKLVFQSTPNPVRKQHCAICGCDDCPHREILSDWNISCNHFTPIGTLKIYSAEEQEL